MKTNLLIAFLLFLLLSCNSNERKIIVYSGGCKENEIISDLEQSVNSNKPFFEKYKISIQIDTVLNKCGYLFKADKKGKEVTTVMTDIDLRNFTEQFFEIQQTNDSLDQVTIQHTNDSMSRKFLVKGSPFQYTKDSIGRLFMGKGIAQEELTKFIKNPKTNLAKGKVLIKNKEMLISMVEPILFDIYGKDNIIGERPYEAYFFDDYGIMMGTSPSGSLGGTFTIAINRKTCEIIGISHGK